MFFNWIICKGFLFQLSRRLRAWRACCAGGRCRFPEWRRRERKIKNGAQKGEAKRWRSCIENYQTMTRQRRRRRRRRRRGEQVSDVSLRAATFWQIWHFATATTRQSVNLVNVTSRRGVDLLWILKPFDARVVVRVNFKSGVTLKL